MAVMLIFASPFVAALIRFPDEIDLIEWFAIEASLLIACVGHVILMRWRLNYLWSQSSLIAFDRREETVSILGGRAQFPAASTYAIVGVSLPNHDNETYSELQLIVSEGDRFVPHLITTSTAGSSTQIYGRLLRDFRAKTGLRTMVAESDGGFWSKGEIRLRDLD